MKLGFYSRIAADNVRKNYRFFIPRILAEAGLLGSFYIVLTLSLDRRLSDLRGGDYIPLLMFLGMLVIALQSAVLMLYINSFLMKQRKREFGLYNVLGMEKRHVGRVMLYETLICCVVSLVIGLAFGMLFYKLCSLLICYLLQTDVVFGFYFIRPGTIIGAALFFVFLDILIYFANLISLARLKPVDLLSSVSTGEKEPKVRWVLLVIGVLTLGAGYGISVTVKNPISAVSLFFVAVFLVIIGTYCLFMTGSVFVFKALKKNKAFYYKKKNFTAVSGLLYRMKRNAIGLASIAILATDVLVMISTTVSLYSGMQQTLDKNYPQHYYLFMRVYDSDDSAVLPTSDDMAEVVRSVAAKYGEEVKQISHQKYLNVTYNHLNGEYIPKVPEAGSDIPSDPANFIFMTEDVYAGCGGERIGLAKDEALLCAFNANDEVPEEITVSGRKFKVKDSLLYFPIQNNALASVSHGYGMVVSDESVLDGLFADQKESYGSNASDYSERLAVTFSDLERLYQVGDEIHDDVSDRLSDIFNRNNPGTEASVVILSESVWSSKQTVLGLYGSFLFLGLLLGCVCLFSTVLIIYYKQISEGYEDRARFQIMKKVGMSDGEIKKTIRTQILLVFFCPLIVAGVHICFAFPMLEKLLQALLLSDTWLFVGCSAITYLVFALIYVLIYSITARTYYKIIR